MDLSFDQYLVREELGCSTTGVVYRVYDPGRQCDAGLKALPPGFAQDPAFYERFRHDLGIIARLEHPAIVTVHHCGQDGESAYVVMQLMNGGSLRERLEQGPVSMKDTVEIIQRICAALDEVHADGVVHGNIRPGNILFDTKGAAYLTDFGFAQLAQDPHSMAIIGAPEYMTPEQEKRERLDARSDVYQMGAVVFKMLTGRAPFDAPTLAALLYRHAYAPVPSAVKLNPNLLPDCDPVIRRAMAKHREDRFATAGEFARDLTAVADRARCVVIPSDSARAVPSTHIEGWFSKVKSAIPQIMPGKAPTIDLAPIAAIFAGFVVFASAFAFLISSAGMYRGEGAVRSGIDQVRSSLELRGAVIAKAAVPGSGSGIDELVFTIANVPGGAPVDLKPVDASEHQLAIDYGDRYQQVANVQWEVEFLIDSNGNSSLEPGELAAITIRELASGDGTVNALAIPLGPGTAFSIEVWRGKEEILSFGRVTPPSLDAVMALP